LANPRGWICILTQTALFCPNNKNAAASGGKAGPNGAAWFLRTQFSNTAGSGLTMTTDSDISGWNLRMFFRFKKLHWAESLCYILHFTTQSLVGLKTITAIKRPPCGWPFMIALVAGEGFEPSTFGL